MELEMENWREWFEDLNRRFEEPLREGGREGGSVIQVQVQVQHNRRVIVFLFSLFSNFISHLTVLSFDRNFTFKFSLSKK